MEIKIIQNITKILDEDRNETSSRISEYYMLVPEEGKALKNTQTNEIFTGVVYIPMLKAKYIYNEIDLKDDSK